MENLSCVGLPNYITHFHSWTLATLHASHMVFHTSNGQWNESTINQRESICTAEQSRYFKWRMTDLFSCFLGQRQILSGQSGTPAVYQHSGQCRKTKGKQQRLMFFQSGSGGRKLMLMWKAFKSFGNVSCPLCMWLIKVWILWLCWVVSRNDNAY